MIILSGESFGLLCQFINMYGNPEAPDSLEYTITKLSDDSIVRDDTVDSPGVNYVIPLSVTDNTITDDSEERKVVVRWIYNGGSDGDVFVYYYTIEQP